MALFAEYEPLRRGKPPPSDLATRPASDDDVPALSVIRAERDGISEELARAIFLRQLGRAIEGRAVLLVATVGCEGAPVQRVAYGVADRMEPEGLPAGWYLGGVVVAPPYRRCGIGARLTRERLEWIAARAKEAFYFVSERNHASIDLHAPFGFVEVARDIRIQGVTFNNGIGLLFRVDLGAASPR